MEKEARFLMSEVGGMERRQIRFNKEDKRGR
jgi:hypothetical protein